MLCGNQVRGGWFDGCHIIVVELLVPRAIELVACFRLVVMAFVGNMPPHEGGG